MSEYRYFFFCKEKKKKENREKIFIQYESIKDIN